MSSEEHIQRLRGILNNADLTSRLPDGGDKLRQRLKLLEAEVQKQQQQETETEDAAVATDNKPNSNIAFRFNGGANNQNNNNDATISKNNNNNNNNNRNDNNVGEESESANNVNGEHNTYNRNSSPKKLSEEDEKYKDLSHLEKSLRKCFGNRLSHVEMIRLSRGITTEQALHAGHPNIQQQQQQQQNKNQKRNATLEADDDGSIVINLKPTRNIISNVAATNDQEGNDDGDDDGLTTSKTLPLAVGLVDCKPLQILDWDQTSRVHNEMLEDERKEELRKIKQRIELFANLS